VENQQQLQVLSFGSSDPLGAVGIQADLASFAAMGCHGLSVITAILIGDTTQVISIEPIDAEIVIDQARTILEDVAVAAFKVGAIGSIENAAVIAEIVADYPDVPLIFDPFSSHIPNPKEETDDFYSAMNELIIPQTTLFVASAMEISRFAEVWREPDAPDTLESDIKQIIGSGCEYVFAMGSSTTGNEIANSLYDQTGVIRLDKWPRLNELYLGAGSTLSAAITALVANGLDISEAVLEAQEFTNEALAHAKRLGMGKWVPDRYFWTLESEEQEPGDKKQESDKEG
jgi:hydroxymethylpyrimidine/phosphomethylpyrimidine kinase